LKEIHEKDESKIHDAGTVVLGSTCSFAVASQKALGSLLEQDVAKLKGEQRPRDP